MVKSFKKIIRNVELRMMLLVDYTCEYSKVHNNCPQSQSKYRRILTLGVKGCLYELAGVKWESLQVVVALYLSVLHRYLVGSSVVKAAWFGSDLMACAGSYCMFTCTLTVLFTLSHVSWPVLLNGLYRYCTFVP